LGKRRNDLTGRITLMDPNLNLTDMFAVLDRRLQVLRRLAGSLSATKPLGPAAMISFLERRTSELCELLAEWARIESALEPWRQRAPEVFVDGRSSMPERMPGKLSPDAPSPGERTRRIDYRVRFQRQIEELQACCRVEAAVLRRSRRTAAALSALLTGTDSTYAPPLSTASSDMGGHGGRGLLVVASKSANPTAV